MLDDGLRPIAVGPNNEHLKIENDDHAHRMLEILDAHPCLKPYIEKLEREAFLTAYKRALLTATPELSEFADSVALKA